MSKLVKGIAITGAFFLVAHIVDRAIYNGTTEDITVTVQGTRTDVRNFMNGDQEKTGVVTSKAGEAFDVVTHKSSPYPDLDSTTAGDKRFASMKEGETYKLRVKGNKGLLGSRNRTVVAIL